MTLFLFIQCSRSQKPISILPVDYYRLDTFKSHPTLPISYTRYFVVRNFSETQLNEKIIDSFAKDYLDTSKKFETNLLIFFKECNKTTVDTINAFPDFIHRHAFSHDLIYEFYSKQNGRIYSKMKFRNGKLIHDGKHKMEVEVIRQENQ